MFTESASKQIIIYLYTSDRYARRCLYLAERVEEGWEVGRSHDPKVDTLIVESLVLFDCEQEALEALCDLNDCFLAVLLDSTCESFLFLRNCERVVAITQ